MKIFIHITSLTLIGVSTVLFTGCSEKQDVNTYTVPKEQPASKTPEAVAQVPAASAAPQDVPTAEKMVPLPGMVEQSQAFDAPTFQAPAGWQTQPLSSMRKGSWTIVEGEDSVEVSVLVFPGDVGGDLANVNRWRMQVALPPIDETVLATSLSAITIDTLPGKLVSFSNTNLNRAITGAILPKDGATWFFKMVGPATLVEKQKAPFKQFVESTTF